MLTVGLSDSTFKHYGVRFISLFQLCEALPYLWEVKIRMVFHIWILTNLMCLTFKSSKLVINQFTKFKGQNPKIFLNILTVVFFI